MIFLCICSSNQTHFKKESFSQTETKSHSISIQPPERDWGCENDSLTGHYGIRYTDFVSYVYTMAPYFIITNLRPLAKCPQCPSKVRGDTKQIHLSLCAACLIKQKQNKENRSFFSLYVWGELGQEIIISEKYFYKFVSS